MKSVDLKPNSAGCLTEHQPVTPLSLSGRLQASLADWYQAWQRRRQYRQDLNHIAQFSSYLLRDIGLTSADIAEAQRRSHFASTDRIGRPG
ncbi:MAG TPA: DUF1127 domain-containing protein [Terriglobia bacterium]|nr:DUF1127 domain-containing protein [Terriglobia bacterium]